MLGLRYVIAIAMAAVLFAPPPRAEPGFVLAADDGVMAHDAWARPSAGGAATGAAYVTLTGGARPDSLVGASTPIAAAAEVHVSFDDHGIMKMRPVEAVPIPAGQTVTLAPGGYHIMLTGLKQTLAAGQSFPLTLTFAHAPAVTVEVTVRAMGPPGGHDGMHM